MSRKLNEKIEIKKSKLLGRLMLSAELGVGLGIAITLLLLGFGNPVSYLDMIDNIVGRAEYNMVAYSNLKDEVALNISEFCSPFNPNTQVTCVISQVGGFYNYNDSKHPIHTPEEYKEKGGVCRDTTVLYKIIFTNLGWETQYIFPYPNHVFLIISKITDDDKIYCTIDGVTKKCVYQ